MTRKTSRTAGKLNRRLVLKGMAAGGAVVATEAIGGFPTVWAQNVKDVTLVVAGGSYAVIQVIGEQATKDLGFNMVMQAVPDDTQINPSTPHPNTIAAHKTRTPTPPCIVGNGLARPRPA